jgi:hypothetical protein
MRIRIARCLEFSAQLVIVALERLWQQSEENLKGNQLLWMLANSNAVGNWRKPNAER